MTKYPTNIKNLVPTLPERGKIKIGKKGELKTSKQGKEFQMPQKLDHFRVVTTVRGSDGNFLIDEDIHKMLGAEPKDIPIKFLYDDPDLILQTRYTRFKGREITCAGDGEFATTKEGAEIPCPCDELDEGRCKINGCLSCVIDGAKSVGGVWRFRTTSFNSVSGLMASIQLIKHVTNGPIAGIPLQLSVRPKTAMNPKDNKTVTIYVVSVEYKGEVEQLREIGLQTALNREKHNISIDEIEKVARQEIEHHPDTIIDDDYDVEFEPEDVAETEGAEIVEPEGLDLISLQDELLTILQDETLEFKRSDLTKYMEFCQGALNKSAREDDHLSIEQTYSRAIDGINGGGLEKFLVGFGKKYEVKSGEPTTDSSEPTDAEKEAILEQENAEGND